MALRKKPVSPFLLCPRTRLGGGPGGVPVLVKRKPSTEDVLTLKGGQRGPSGHGMAVLAPARLPPCRWALTAKVQRAICHAWGAAAGPEPELSLWMNLEARPGRLQPGTSQAAGCCTEHSRQEHSVQRIPHHPGDQLQLRSVGAAPHDQASHCGSPNLLT